MAKWKKAAQKAIADIVHRGKVPIICGGTGFWIDALVYDQSLPDVRPDAKLRARLQKLTPAQLFARLEKLDPVRAATIDRHNPVRLIRALEIVMTTGRPVPKQSFHSPYEVLYLVLSPKKELAKRIERRLDTRLKHGMLSEVKKLHASGVSWKKSELFGLEYRRLARYLQHKITRTEMRESLLHDIIAYSKRQITWFKRNKSALWITSPTRAMRLARQFLSE